MARFLISVAARTLPAFPSHDATTPAPPALPRAFPPPLLPPPPAKPLRQAVKGNMTHVLCIVGAVEVITGYAALGAGHVSTDDEVGAPEVLADHHVLHRLSVYMACRQSTNVWIV